MSLFIECSLWEQCDNVAWENPCLQSASLLARPAGSDWLSCSHALWHGTAYRKKRKWQEVTERHVILHLLCHFEPFALHQKISGAAEERATLHIHTVMNLVSLTVLKNLWPNFLFVCSPASCFYAPFYFPPIIRHPLGLPLMMTNVHPLISIRPLAEPEPVITHELFASEGEIWLCGTINHVSMPRASAWELDVRGSQGAEGRREHHIFVFTTVSVLQVKGFLTK